MKKTFICSLIILSLLVMTITANAIEISENEIIETESPQQFLQCDYASREITSYTPSLDNANIESTWKLFPHQEVSQMTTSLNAGASDNAVSQLSIIGESNLFDAHPISAPYSSVAYLLAYFDSNGDNVADYIMNTSGFLVSKNVLVTSAQGVVPRDPSTTTLKELRIYFGLDSDSLSSQSYIYPFRWTWSPAWHDSTISWKNDYCVIELTQDVTRPFYFNCIESSNFAINQNIYITGYPNDYHYYQKASHGQVTYSDYFVCNFNNDMLSGMTGGPIYNNYCIGILTYQATTFNMGSLFTESIYNLICSKIIDNS